MVGKCTRCQPIRGIWTTIDLQAVMVYHFRLGLRPFLDAVENITQPSDDQKWTIKQAHQLGADTFLLLRAVQPHCITPVVSVLVYRAVVIVLLLAITTHFQVLAGKLVDLFHLLTELGSSTLRPNIISCGMKPIDSCTEERYAIIRRGRY